MAKYDFPKFKIRIAPDSKKRQGLQVGDVVRRQYADNEISRYSLMVVTDTGTENVAGSDGKELYSPYFVGALLEGDEPRDGELLDFVRVSSLTNPSRSGALYLTASDAESPYMDVIDGMAVEHSLCRPNSVGSNGYTIMGGELLNASYISEEGGVSRICTLRRNATVNSQTLGMRQVLPSVAHPQRIVISFRVRASKPLTGLPLVVGYADGSERDASVTFNAGTLWSYCLFAVTIDLPPSRERTLTIDLSEHLKAEGDTFSIAELNVVLQSDLTNFSAASKVRVGKITGIADPLFGVLEGYGAYFQNLYATRNVNVAGTLTAGDSEGFASTFYVGRIHKNALRNSLKGDFQPAVPYESAASPTGIGQVARILGSANLICQDEAWCERHAGQRYCFSFWAKGDAGSLTLSYFGEVIAVLPLDGGWTRHHAVFTVEHIPGSGLQIEFRADATCFTCGYQLETGEHPTLYQPTDEVLDETDAYGAWFSRGGIGGTIQHPLLRLNDDGSISSCDGSFVINADGTGHFAGGRFRWSKDAIELRGVTIRWEDFDDKAQENLLPKSVSISGTDTFHYADALQPIAQPASITLVATEQNFSAEARRWEYLSKDGTWKDAGGRSTTFLLFPDFHAWEDYDVLTLRYTALYQEQAFKATATITKQYDGESAYSVYIKTDKGTVLQNGAGTTTLSAHVMRGAVEVTEHLADGQFLWTRQSDDPDGDALWNSTEHRGRTLTINGEDVARKAVFDCDVTL